MLDQRTISETTFDRSKAEIVMMPSNRIWAYTLLRVTFGIVFLFSGFGKFLGGVGNFVARLEQQFAGKLPMFLVVPFAYTLPFLETLVGTFLVLGLFNSASLIVSGLLLASLTFGLVMAGEPQAVGHNVIYALVNFVLLWMVRYNKYSVDRVFHDRSTRW